MRLLHAAAAQRWALPPVNIGGFARARGLRVLTVVVLSIFAWVPAATPGLAAAAGPYRFLQFNTAGNVRYGGDSQAAVDIGNSILALRPHVATINEVCLNQATSLDAWLTSHDYPMQVVHTQTIPPFVTSKGIICRYGNALLSAGEGSQPQPPRTTLLPSAALEQRALTCAEVRLPLAARACVTHLTNGTDADRSDVRNGQVAVVAQGSYVAGSPGVLGGDMNVSPRGDRFHPDQLDPLYRWFGSGPYVEVEGTRALCDPVFPPCGPTLGLTKVDYVFLDRASWRSLSATTAGARVSDHRLLKGYAVH